MNLPNKLTIFRMALVPIIMIVYWIEPLRNMIVFEGAYHLSVCNLIIFILALTGTLTDFFDGHYARKHNMVTDFGKFLDPVADKLLVITVFMIILDQSKYYSIRNCFYYKGEPLDELITWWMILIILAREFIVTGIRLVAAGKKKVIAASVYGKAKTVVQFITMLILLLGCAVLENPDTAKLVPLSVGYVIFVKLLIIATLALTIFSGVDYVVKNFDVIKEMGNKKQKNVK